MPDRICGADNVTSRQGWTCQRDHNHSTREGAIACDARLADPFPNCRMLCYASDCPHPTLCRASGRNIGRDSS